MCCMLADRETGRQKQHAAAAEAVETHAHRHADQTPWGIAAVNQPLCQAHRWEFSSESNTNVVCWLG